MPNPPAYIMKPIQYLLCLALLTSAARCETVPLPEGRRLRTVVKDNYPGNLHIGATTGWESLQTAEGILLNREFSYITPDNDFKQSLVHPEPGIWRWEAADQWVVSARQNGQWIRMHAPISPQCSRWAKTDSRTPSELETNLAEYMTALCKRYNGEAVVKWLDVVNETIDAQGLWFGPQAGVRDWENPWPQIGFEEDIPPAYPSLRKQGVPRYIIQAFEIANQHAPDLKLIINQHQLIEEAPTQTLKELVLYLRGRGLRVDGIGWQAHLSRDLQAWSEKGSPQLRALEALIDWAHENDLEFHVTENNIHVPVTNAYDANAVASIFENMVGTVVGKRDTGVVSWNLWSITDKPHFRDRRKRVLGLWDEEARPQPAYYRVQAVLEHGGIPPRKHGD
jgi:GH35 family endo-1,4-beta-xylanase